MSLEYTTHSADLKLGLVLVDERVLHSGWLAKYTAAFVRMSRFISAFQSFIKPCNLLFECNDISADGRLLLQLYCMSPLIEAFGRDAKTVCNVC